jgi:hypothetical protein
MNPISLPVVFHDLPGKPAVLISKQSLVATSPSRTSPSASITLRGDQYLSRNSSPTRHRLSELSSSSALVPCDAIWVPSYSVGRLRSELVTASVSQLRDLQQFHNANSSDYVPVLGERFLVVHINHRVPGDAEAVSVAARNIQCSLPGAPASFRVYSTETKIVVRCLWLAGDGAAAAHVTSTSATLLEGVSGSTKLSSVRKLLMAKLSHNHRRPFEDLGWRLAMAVPMVSRHSTGVSNIESFVVTDGLECVWDINALRGAMPLCEQPVPEGASVAMTTHCSSPNVVVTIYLHVYSPHGVVAAPIAPLTSRPLTAADHRIQRGEVRDIIVKGNVSIRSACVVLDPTPTLVSCVSVHEDEAAGDAFRLVQQPQSDASPSDATTPPRFVFASVATDSASGGTTDLPHLPARSHDRGTPGIARSLSPAVSMTPASNPEEVRRTSVYLLDDGSDDDDHATTPSRHHHHHKIPFKTHPSISFEATTPSTLDALRRSISAMEARASRNPSTASGACGRSELIMDRVPVGAHPVAEVASTPLRSVQGSSTKDPTREVLSSPMPIYPQYQEARHSSRSQSGSYIVGHGMQRGGAASTSADGGAWKRFARRTTEVSPAQHGNDC